VPRELLRSTEQYRGEAVTVANPGTDLCERLAAVRADLVAAGSQWLHPDMGVMPDAIVAAVDTLGDAKETRQSAGARPSPYRAAGRYRASSASVCHPRR
jgi:hypothetical protein